MTSKTISSIFITNCTKKTKIQLRILLIKINSLRSLFINLKLSSNIISTSFNNSWNHSQQKETNQPKFLTSHHPTWPTTTHWVYHNQIGLCFSHQYFPISYKILPLRLRSIRKSLPVSFQSFQSIRFFMTTNP